MSSIFTPTRHDVEQRGKYQDLISSHSVQIDQDAVSASALIHSALKYVTDAKSAGTNADLTKAAITMKKLSVKLAVSTLYRWYLGAALVVGNRDQCVRAFHNLSSFADTEKSSGSKTYAMEDEAVSKAREIYKLFVDGKTPGEMLKKLRIDLGQTWDGAFAAADLVMNKSLAQEYAAITKAFGSSEKNPIATSYI